MKEHKLKIEKLVSGGYGLGHENGQVILAPYVAPGDEVLLEDLSVRKGVSWGNVKQILYPSPARTEPFCPHYMQCGGCQFQHISYAAQVEYKRLILDDALRRLGGCKDVEVDSCVPSPAQRGYRSRVRLHCHKGQIGFHQFQSNTLIPLDSCPMLADSINACLKQISTHLLRHPMRGLSEIQMMEDTDCRVMLLLEMNSFPGAGAITGLKESVAAAGAVARVSRHSKNLWGDNYSALLLEGRTFRVGAASFFQANLSLLPALIQHVTGAVRANSVDLGVELYAGVGLFSIMLSEKAKKLVAIEWNRDAADDAAENLKANRIENVEALAAPVEDGLELLLSRGAQPDLVVMDPPREGLSSAARTKLMQLSPEQLIYVSCNPATLARDIKFFMTSGGYRLEKVTPLDMFPHTAHVECVCSLVRK